MSLPLTSLYRKLTPKDRSRVKKYIANPLLFLLEEYNDLSPLEQKKFKTAIGVKRPIKPASEKEEASTPKVETPTEVIKTSETPITEVQTAIELMDLDGKNEAPKVETTSSETTSTQVVPYQPLAKIDISKVSESTSKADDTESDESSIPDEEEDEPPLASEDEEDDEEDERDFW